MYELRDMLEAMPGGMAFAVRDFALVTLAGELSAAFPGQLVFKGGFVLPHAHGHLRFSKDVDATRHAPPAHKLEADDVAAAISEAVLGTPVAVDVGHPFYEPFEILTMQVEEMAAEKLRALAQRLRETDLADLPGSRRNRLAPNQVPRAIELGPLPDEPSPEMRQ